MTTRNLTLRIETVTPLMAEAMLGKMMSNRNLRTKRVAELADYMRQDRFDGLNGETIKVDAAGVVVDGQHRLHAVVHSGKPQMLAVMYGVSPTAGSTCDGGAGRTLGDVLKIEGIPNATRIAAMVNFVCAYDRETLASGQNSTRKQDALEYARKNHPALYASVAATRGGEVFTGSMIAAAHYLIVKHSRTADKAAKVAEFFEGLRDGVFAPRYRTRANPAYILREFKNTLDRTEGLMVRQHFLCHAVLAAWNAYANGHPINRGTLAAYLTGSKTPKIV